MDNLTINIALQYNAMGLCILPVKMGEKRPALIKWRDYINKRSTRDEIMMWFAGTAGANFGIGAVTGRISGYVVLDVEKEYKGDINELLHKYPTQLVARTGSGGYHFYYKYPQNYNGTIGNRVQFAPHMDIRGDGGFIVLPPTRHPDTGLPYEWIFTEGAGEFPMSLLTIENPDAKSGERWITEIMRGVASGGRNQAAARLAGYFFGKGLTADVVEDLLISWNERNSPPLSQQEIHTTIKSVKRYHINVTNPVTSVEFNPDTYDEKIKPPPQFGFIKMSDYIKSYGGEGVEWAVQDWLGEKSISFMVAPPESYKTWLLVDLAISVALGLPFLGQYRTYTRGKVLIIQQEDSHMGLTERLSVVLGSKLGLKPEIGVENFAMPILPDVPIYIHPDRMLKFADKGIMDDFEKAIAEIRPALVLIDPLYSATSMDNYMADSTTDMFRLKQMRDKYGCSFVLAHHSKKNIEDGSTQREDGWGSQFLNAFLEAGWQIRRDKKLPQNEIIVRRHSKTMGNLDPITLTFDISTKLPFKYEVLVKDFKMTEIATPKKDNEAAEDILGSIPQDGRTITISKLSDICGKDRTTVSKLLKKLENRGQVQKMPDGYRMNIRREE